MIVRIDLGSAGPGKMLEAELQACRARRFDERRDAILDDPRIGGKAALRRAYVGTVGLYVEIDDGREIGVYAEIAQFEIGGP